MSNRLCDKNSNNDQFFKVNLRYVLAWINTRMKTFVKRAAKIQIRLGSAESSLDANIVLLA